MILAMKRMKRSVGSYIIRSCTMIIELCWKLHYQELQTCLDWYDGIQAGMIKFHQTTPIDMVIDRSMNPMLSPDHHQLTGSWGNFAWRLYYWLGRLINRGARSIHSDVKVVFMNVFCISFKGRIKTDPWAVAHAGIQLGYQQYHRRGHWIVVSRRYRIFGPYVTQGHKEASSMLR